jgi:hypothetical protein
LEQELHCPEVPQSLLDEARGERAPWQEFHAHSVSLNAALTEALQVHGGRSLQIFEVRISVPLTLVFPFSSSPQHFKF